MVVVSFNLNGNQLNYMTRNNLSPVGFPLIPSCKLGHLIAIGWQSLGNNTCVYALSVSRLYQERIGQSGSSFYMYI